MRLHRNREGILNTHRRIGRLLRLAAFFKAAFLGGVLLDGILVQVRGSTFEATLASNLRYVEDCMKTGDTTHRQKQQI